MNTTTGISEKLTSILDVYSEKFHRNLTGEHRVASPLGAWCLLAFLAASDPNPDQAVTDNLGCSTGEAKTLLVQLLTEKPDVVSLAVSSWINPLFADSDSFTKWIEDVKELSVPNISIPKPAELNSWVDEQSLGLIREFPVDIKPSEFIALFATVVATDIKWNVPFNLIIGDSIMEAAWKVKNILFEMKENTVRIHRDPVLGDFAVHCGTTGGRDLNVYSVVPLADGVSEADTMAVARSVATGGIRQIPLSALELGASENGRIEIFEQEVTASNPRDKFTALIPAWKTANNFDLLESDLGFMESVTRFNDVSEKMEPDEKIEVAVAQTTVAEYNTEGFKAAALTHMIMNREAAMRPEKHVIRHAFIRFNTAFAVVAVTQARGGVWKSLPIFDGWVTEAIEATEPDESESK